MKLLACLPWVETKTEGTTIMIDREVDQSIIKESSCVASKSHILIS